MAEYADVLLPVPVDRPFTYGVPAEFRERLRPGHQVRVPFRNRELLGVVAAFPKPPPFAVRQLAAIEHEEPLFDAPLLKLGRWIADQYLCSWGEALQAMVPSGVRRGTAARTIPAARLSGSPPAAPPGTEARRRVLDLVRQSAEPLPIRTILARAKAGRGIVTALVKTGHLEIVQLEPDHDAGAYGAVAEDHPPTTDQQAALREIAAALDGRTPRGVLLHGVTGSGKTEVYLQAIRSVVSQGRQAIVLVPEIALTPQAVARFRARFPRTAVLHSVLSAGERAEQWRTIRRGEVDVIVGARSAVFAPARALGLIILDEEHEHAYKQESDPRYHAREVALKRAELEGAVAILGSATPSLETLQAARTGRLRLAELPARIGGRPLPPIEVVDMLAERRDVKRFPILSRQLTSAIRDAAGRKEQTLLFLNARGYTRLVRCRRCLWTFRCTRCDVALPFHKTEGLAECHSCGRTFAMPEICPDCRTGTLWQFGVGTERIEEEVGRVFPGIRVTRMDSDAMRSKADLTKALAGLWDGTTDVLVGTQMIAKGFDVPNVTVIGVVNADTGFFVKDFRAAERTFQLVTQVAGRAGRGPKGGRVIVQTFNPNHYAITCAAAHDVAGFVERELAFRREEGYPPFSRLVRILFAGGRHSFVEAQAAKFAEGLAREVPPMLAQVLGPGPLPRLKGRHRRHLLVKAKDLEAVRTALRKLMPGVPKTRALQVVVDVDPVTLG